MDLCIFQVRKQPAGTHFSVFLSDGRTPKRHGARENSPPLSSGLVHLVVIKRLVMQTVQGAPSGEAFIQMDSEKSAESTAVTKNKKLMFVSGVRRYVEVIQCSGDEMALVLQQGLPAPAPAALSSLPQSSASIHAANGAVLPTGFWSLPPPAAPATDLTLLLQQPSTIPLPSAPGMLLITSPASGSEVL